MNPFTRENATGNVSAKTVPFTPPMGRSALCPCGSGKKYKKCCLPKN
ncbi:MAG: SEC-C domain-containing protein [Verrucomicrobiae bacterium]|nr:SEC-C domain-containing protein [Verrucomicrobiae bacterium]